MNSALFTHIHNQADYSLPQSLQFQEDYRQVINFILSIHPAVNWLDKRTLFTGGK